MSAAVKSRVTRRVNQIKPQPAVKRNSRNELSKEIRKLPPKSSIKGGPSLKNIIFRKCGGLPSSSNTRIVGS